MYVFILKNYYVDGGYITFNQAYHTYIYLLYFL